MKSFHFLFLACAMLASCNSSGPSNKSADSDSVSRKATRTVIDKKPVIFRGLYISGNEVNTFQDCNSRLTYWVTDSAGMQQAYRKALPPLPYPYESVYAEVKGYLAGKSDQGYASEYPNVLVVTSISKIEAKTFKTPCYDYEFIALGTEPFWSVDIVPAEQRIVLKDVAREKTTEFPYNPANIGGGVYRFESMNDKKEKIVIVIREENCNDGMSDREYNYSAEVEIQGRSLKGCAIKKGDQ